MMLVYEFVNYFLFPYLLLLMATCLRPITLWLVFIFCVMCSDNYIVCVIAWNIFYIPWACGRACVRACVSACDRTCVRAWLFYPFLMLWSYAWWNCFGLAWKILFMRVRTSECHAKSLGLILRTCLILTWIHCI